MKTNKWLMPLLVILLTLVCAMLSAEEGYAEKSEIQLWEVYTMENGLTYTIVTEGTGDVATKGNTVVVHYTGTFTDGRKFDSSVDREQPFEFRLGAGMVIQGWDLGVEGMRIGETRILNIPSDLAYGQRGAGGVIPPNTDLIFEVQLLDIKKGD